MDLVAILVPLGVAVALPVCIVSIIFRSAMAADRNRKEIVLAAAGALHLFDDSLPLGRRLRGY